MSKFFFNNNDSIAMAKFVREERARAQSEKIRILGQANQIITKCEDAKQEVNDASSITFLGLLSEYLKQRIKKDSGNSNIAQIEKRANFIEKLAAHIKTNNIAGQLELLKDEKIKEFKGFFSSKLYDILAARRSALQPQKETLQKKTPRCGL